MTSRRFLQRQTKQRKKVTVAACRAQPSPIRSGE